MRLYRVGDAGEAVGDIQDRLAALGYNCDGDPRGEFAGATEEAVTSFQRSRGLAPDGVVGPDTWRALYEAGYRLGDRLLFLRRPMLRGEDVAELQSRLNNLGFDSGKVDGIFGSQTAKAVIDFQQNRVLPADGKAGPEVITELILVTRGELRAGRQAIREMEWLRSLPRSVVGTRVFFDPACRNPAESQAAWTAAGAASLELQERGGLPLMSRSADTSLPERVRAGRANRMGAELIVSLQLAEAGEDAIYFYATDRGRSEAGQLLALRVAEVVGGPVEGRATSILRETRAPAIVVAHHRLNEDLGRKIVAGLEAFFLSER